MDVNTPLGGSMPVEAAPVLRFSGILLTAVAATSTHDYTVTFLGTSTGHLKKVRDLNIHAMRELTQGVPIKFLDWD